MFQKLFPYFNGGLLYELLEICDHHVNIFELTVIDAYCWPTAGDTAQQRYRCDKGPLYTP